jgi:hypothetical protein
MGRISDYKSNGGVMKKFLLWTLAGTAALFLMLYVQNRERLKREAQLFDELCPERPEGAPPPDEDGGEAT